MADDVDKDLKDNRFSYLLQPIRDLAANWDVNIAGELVEYLEELENITFTIEGCGPALNFAEAALLIQGTTCVFSKKVEYLHNLVYQALETILDKKQKEKQTAVNKDKAGRRNAASDDHLDDAEAFFNLDTQLELATDSEINLDDDDETAPPALVRPPTALLALEDAASGQGQQGNPGEVGTYRLAQCSVHISGALLLESRDGELFDAHLRLLRRGVPGNAGHDMMGDLIASFRAASQPVAVGTAAAAGTDFDAMDAVGDGAQEAPGYDYDMGHDGYCDDEGGFATADDTAEAEGNPTVAAMGPTAGCAADADHHMSDADQVLDLDNAVPDWLAQPAAGLDTADAAGNAADAAAEQPAATEVADAPVSRARQHRARGRQAAADAVGDSGDYYDPYVPLDPTEPGNLPIKPLQVRKPKRRANAATDLQTAASSIACLNSSHHPQLHWAEFAYVLDKLSAATAAARKKGTSRHQQQQQPLELPPGLQRIEPEIAAVMDWQDAAAAEQREQQALLADDADAGDFAGDGYENDYSDDLQDNINALNEAGQEAAGGLRPWATEAIGVPDWMTGGADGAADGEMTYEELCRSHIESLIAAAAAQQVQSELAVRVSGWRARIDPILAAEEDRSAFDIHDYGTKILDRLVEVTEDHDQQPQQQEQQMAEATQRQQKEAEVIDFKQVAAAQDSFEVCRLFAAMLQLVNNRNVNLVKETASDQAEVEEDSNNAGQTCSKLQLQLLSVARVHEAMAEGLAGGNNGVTGLQQHDSQLEPPPPRKQRGGAKKAKKNAAGITVAAGADEDSLTGAKGKHKAGKKSKVSKKGLSKDPDNSSSEDDGLGDDLTDSEVEEPPAPGKYAAVKSTKGQEAAGSNKARPARGGKGRTAASTGGGHSDSEFDANAENHVVAGGAAGWKGVDNGKGSKKPPAKRAKKTEAATMVA